MGKGDVTGDAILRVSTSVCQIVKMYLVRGAAVTQVTINTGLRTQTYTCMSVCAHAHAHVLKYTSHDTRFPAKC